MATNLLIYGPGHFGNIFCGRAASPFVYEGIRCGCANRAVPGPPPRLCAYYTYLEKAGAPIAVLQFRTHGSLEFLPRQARWA